MFDMLQFHKEVVLLEDEKPFKFRSLYHQHWVRIMGHIEYSSTQSQDLQRVVGLMSEEIGIIVEAEWASCGHLVCCLREAQLFKGSCERASIGVFADDDHMY